MENKKLFVLYEQNYDLIDFLGTITEDKLNNYIQYFINKKLIESKIKFKVIDIKKYELQNTVQIAIVYDAYDVTYGGKTTHYPESNAGISFDYFVVEESEINEVFKD